MRHCMSSILIVLCLLGVSGATSANAAISAQETPAEPLVALIGGEVWTLDPVFEAWEQHSSDTYFEAAAIAPDGTQVALWTVAPDFAEEVLSGEILGDVAVPTEVWIMNLPDGTLEPIALQPADEGVITHQEPRFTPDNRALIWTEVEDSTRYFLVVYDRAAQTVERHPIEFPLVNFGGYPSPPIFTPLPDQRAAVVWFGSAGHASLSGYFAAVFNLDGTARTDPVSLMMIPTQIEWARRGEIDQVAVYDNSATLWAAFGLDGGTAEFLDRPVAISASITGDFPALVNYPNGFDYLTWLTLTDSGPQIVPYSGRYPALISLAPVDSPWQWVYASDDGLVITGVDGAQRGVAYPPHVAPSEVEALAWVYTYGFIDVPGVPYRVEAICDGAPLSVMSQAEYGQVVAAQVPVYREPEGEVLQTLPRGAAFRLVEGLQCGDGVIWWGVATESGQQGWIRETDDERYLIAPA